MNSPIISLSKVAKKYRKRDALQGIDLDVIPSEITGIIGPDGAGKSTLLKICSGVLSYKARRCLWTRIYPRIPNQQKSTSVSCPRA